jgi:hypothetical protein
MSSSIPLLSHGTEPQFGRDVCFLCGSVPSPERNIDEHVILKLGLSSRGEVSAFDPKAQIDFESPSSCPVYDVSAGNGLSKTKPSCRLAAGS